MRIANVYVRFFRSFNYDYLRKAHPDATSLPWEDWDGGGWYPFVNVSLEPSITTRRRRERVRQKPAHRRNQEGAWAGRYPGW